jgi:tetratricopeptide (TPR) repeat protein
VSVFLSDSTCRFRSRTRRGKVWEHYRKALQHQPPGAYQAHANLAAAHQKLKQLDAALAELYRAIARQPGEPQLYHTRAHLHLERGDRAAARRDFKEAIARGVAGRPEPWLAGAHVWLGCLKHQAGEHEAALKEFDAALLVVKDYPLAHQQRVETLLALNRYAEAGRALDAYLKVGKPTSKVHQARGLIYAGQRDYPGQSRPTPGRWSTSATRTRSVIGGGRTCRPRRSRWPWPTSRRR